MNIEQEIAGIKKEMSINTRDVENVNKICDKMDAYADKYTHFLDMMIEREKDDKEYRKMIRDKLTTGGVWAFVSFVCIAVFHELKAFLK